VNRVQSLAFTNLDPEIAMKTVVNARSAATRSVVAAAFITLAFAASAGAARAAQPSYPLTKVVSYADLDLNAESGAKVLYIRPRAAATEVCTPLESIDLTQRRIWQGCVNKAVASAVMQVNKATVTALHNVNVSRARAG
jgi:UrcA family protein